MALVYLTIDQAIETHAKTVDKSGGGAMGHLDVGQLESVLHHIQNDEYYPTFESKLTHLFFSSNKFHSFEDGNKRIAITLCLQMLLINGYLYCTGSFMRQMENVSHHVAAGNIGKELLHEIITAVVDENTDDEDLKLKVFKAISEGEDVVD